MYEGEEYGGPSENETVKHLRTRSPRPRAQSQRNPRVSKTSVPSGDHSRARKITRTRTQPERSGTGERVKKPGHTDTTDHQLSHGRAGEDATCGLREGSRMITRREARQTGRNITGDRLWLESSNGYKPTTSPDRNRRWNRGKRLSGQDYPKMHLMDGGPGAILSFETFLSSVSSLLVTV